MSARGAAIGGLVALLLCAGGAGWHWVGHGSSPDAAPAAPASLPVPPVPPRLVQDPRYEQCLAMLENDPRGAAGFAEGWTDGAEGAAHCRALAEVALGDVEIGAGDLQRIAATSLAPAPARAAVYEQAAQAWLMAGNAAEALGASTSALALAPDNEDLLVDRAVAAAALNRFEDARSDLTHALEIDPARVEALVLRATAWRHLGHLDLAQDDVDRALALDPENAEALLERGILRQRHDDAAGARGDWQRAIELAPNSATADLAEQNLALLAAGPADR